MITDKDIEMLGNRLVMAIEKIPSIEKVAEMQNQIDEDFRFKQYLIQRLEGQHPTTIVFDDLMSKSVIERLDKILSHDDEQHS